MRVLRVVGPSDADETALVERLAERLSRRGRVGTVEHADGEPDLGTEGTNAARHRAAGAARTEGVASDGTWFATGEDRTLADALEDLSVSCDYALVEGSGAVDLPTVALGDAAARDSITATDDSTAAAADDSTTAAEDPIATAPTADDVDLDAVVEALAATDPYETLSSLVASVERASDADRAGAIATFTGRVRERDAPDDEPTEHLEFERYDDVAAERMATIRSELLARDGVHDVRCHHRTGVVEAGEHVVHVVVLAGHRREAFETVEDGIDRIKEEVPLFKKEVTVSGEFWAHESGE